MSDFLQYPLEHFIMLSVVIGSLLGAYFILRINWKRYGLLFFLSGLIGNILCMIFLLLNFYKFPVVPFHLGIKMPVSAILTAFPYYVLLGVRYSPKRWAWKIPFYMGMVNLGILVEKLLEEYTEIIEYTTYWDTFDSYAVWWVYLLVFEYIGGRLIPQEDRKPIHVKSLWYGRWAWFVLHFIFLVTIFLAGVYVGWLL
ncbi:CBO0543 family protein [Pontibacillus yanchengensis]|uniref:Uncharacterized protein n=1 Tax=Pontibacillus yanchengensis Y32 TaxID=1385514 RepID=A0A0A2TAE8_9BACI|nr:CBO0543 family protein [Pontibacillus yanchengensis]KGP72797.1 hypothetical protein N782_10590 [Pontibacillus yanchengensis Y32]